MLGIDVMNPTTIGIVIGVIGFLIVRGYIASVNEPIGRVVDGENIETHNYNYYQKTFSKRISKPGLMLMIFGVVLLIVGVGLVLWG